MEIYVLVYVDFDYYRFQSNIYASTTKKDVVRYAKKNYPKVDVYEYEDESSEESKNLKQNETAHLWIEKF